MRGTKTLEIPDHEQTNMKQDHFHHIPIVIVVVLMLSVCVVEFYAVRELAAALIIFGVLFGTIGTVLLILILIEETALKGMSYVEERVSCVRTRHTAVSTGPGAPIVRSKRWM